MRARARVVFRGHVQGVYFRAHCQEKARELGLHGYVRNRHDGTVEAIFEGERERVEACIEWNRTSQPNARVGSAHVTWEEPTGEFATFDVRP
ncbi:MAG: acylphosphatase [Methanobacteriota archaeon]